MVFVVSGECWQWEYLPERTRYLRWTIHNAIQHSRNIIFAGVHIQCIQWAAVWWLLSAGSSGFMSLTIIAFLLKQSLSTFQEHFKSIVIRIILLEPKILCLALTIDNKRLMQQPRPLLWSPSPPGPASLPWSSSGWLTPLCLSEQVTTHRMHVIFRNLW